MSAGKLLALKAAIAAVALSGGGVALAATTGHLPAQAGGHPAASASAAASKAASTPESSKADPSASPSPSIHGLCNAYANGAGGNPGKALDSPAFTALINAAGGRGKVPSYCASVLKSSPSRNSNGHANANGHSGKNSDGGQASHSTGKPTTPASSHSGGNSDTGASMHVSGVPTVAPVAPTPHPSGKPSLRPAGG